MPKNATCKKVKILNTNINVSFWYPRTSLYDDKMYQGSTLLIQGGQFTSSESKSFTVKGASCPESEIRFQLKTDQYTLESAWSLKTSAGVKVIYKGRNNYSSTNTEYSDQILWILLVLH